MFRVVVCIAGLLVCGGLIEVLQSLRISPICSPTLVAWLRAPSCQTDIRLVVSQASTATIPRSCMAALNRKPSPNCRP